MLPKRAMALAMGAALVAAAACKPVVVKDGPDAAALFKECPAKPIAFCDAMAPGTGGCTADAHAKSKVVSELPAGETYPVGCVANLIVPILDGDCRVSATCRCTGDALDAGADASWVCFP